jgi:hypothetical protein
MLPKPFFLNKICFWERPQGSKRAHPLIKIKETSYRKELFFSKATLTLWGRVDALEALILKNYLIKQGNQRAL